MHHGAPAHLIPAVLGVYNNQWLGKGGPTILLPFLPDLNPLDFYLWEHLQIIVYAAPADNEEALRHRVVDACQNISNYPGIFERMRRSMMRHVEAYFEYHRGRFDLNVLFQLKLTT
jgi:hypothetical protein